MSANRFTAITIVCPDESEMLVRRWADGVVEVDVRVRRDNWGPRVWTPVKLLGGSFTVEECGHDFGADRAAFVADLLEGDPRV